MRLLTWNINALVRAINQLSHSSASYSAPSYDVGVRLKLYMHAPQAGTVRNFELKHGSFRGFLDAYHIDILSVQVCFPVLNTN